MLVNDNSNQLVNKIITTFEKAEKEIFTLSQSGWTIPMDFSLGEIIDLIEISKSGEIDAFFVEYYEQNNRQNFVKLTREIIDNKNISKWKRILKECVEAYNRGHYCITIPSLITVLEGLLSKYLKPDQMNDIRMIKLCREQLEKFEEGNINKIIWISIRNFIECLYEKKSFDENKPYLLNRHWILHGRDDADWKVQDSLRLFHAMHTLVTTLDLFKE